MTCTFYLVLSLLFVALAALPASAQVITGTPPFGSFGGGPDVINLANLNAHIDIPIFRKPGRGTALTYDLGYDSAIWYPVGSSGNQTWQPIGNWGWSTQTQMLTGVAFVIANGGACYTTILGHTKQTGSFITYTGWEYTDPRGEQHFYNSSTRAGWGVCNGQTVQPVNANETASDGSGLTLTTYQAIISDVAYDIAQITSTNGDVSTPPINSPTSAGGFTDRNGNLITMTSAGVITDTLGTTALTISGSGTAASPMKLTYTPPSGTPTYYEVNYTNYTIATNFGISGIHEFKSTAAVPLVTSVVLPDGSQYTFSYESTPSTPSSGVCTPYAGTTCVSARLKSITLPTGGIISYFYQNGNNGILPDGSTATLSRTTPDGVWSYSQLKGTAAASTTTITDPQNNQTSIQFQGIYETERQIYQGLTSGTLLQTINTCYNTSSPPCTGSGVTLPITTRTVVNQLGSSGPQSKQVFSFSTSGVPTEEDDYDFGSGSPGPLLKKTLVAYAPLGSGLTGFPQTVSVQDGGGVVRYRQDTAYDQNAFTGGNCITGAPQHNDTAYGCSFNVRGNATTVTTYTNPSGPSGGISQTFAYDSLGNLRVAKDALSNSTTLGYTDAWATSFCPPPSATYAYATSVTNALNQATNNTYDSCAGTLASTKDPNNKTTSFIYDSLLRTTQESFPDGGQTTWTYNSEVSTTITTKMNSSQNLVSSTLLDGLGRIKQEQLNSDPEGVDYTDITYDSLGRAATLSNPYRSTSDPTYGVTAMRYDALNRPCVIIPPDGTAVSGGTCPSSQPTNDLFAVYVGNATTVTDQAGKSREGFSDGLGRLTQLFEDSAGLNYENDYQYDALNNIITVTQKGGSTNSANWRVRTYTYDSLSRLVCESNPEIQIASCPYPDNGSYTAGTIRNAYDSNSNQTSRITPAPNQTGSSTITATYAYDALNRVTNVSYSDGTTPSSTFQYDSGSFPGGATPSNIIGRLELASTSNTITSFSYDSLGRTAWRTVCTPLNCGTGGWSFYYTYDLAGDLTQFNDGTYTSPQNFIQTFDAAGRVTQVASTASDSQHPATLFTADSTYGYFPFNAVHKATVGNGLLQTAAYNTGLQPCRINLNSSSTMLSTCADAVPAGNLLDFNYGFNVGIANNGSIASWTATGQQAFSRTYTYDTLNRLNTMADSNSSQTCRGLSWTIDPWGNRTDQTQTAGTCWSFHATVSAQNRLSGTPYQYDAAGNLTADGSHTYFYDAENRLIQVDGTAGSCSTATACYTYDALGERARRTVGSTATDYVFDANGQVGWELLNGAFNRGYVRSNGQFLAEYSAGTTYFAQTDHLGSTRLLTTTTQSVAQCSDYYPYGEIVPCGGTTVTPEEFTGLDNDTETGLDHAWFRQYTSSYGRWMTTDPAGIASTDPTNPQSWNQYSYALNDASDLADPLGLFTLPTPGCSTGVETGWYYGGLVATTSCSGGASGGGAGSIPYWPCIGFVSQPCGLKIPAPPGCAWGGPGLVCTTPIVVTTSAPFLSGVALTIGPETDFDRTKQWGCLGVGLKEAIGGLVLKKEINAAVNYLMGASADSTVPQIVTGSAVSIPLHVGLDELAGVPNARPGVELIRTALREQGYKVSGNTIARTSKLLGKLAFVAHIAFAANDGREAYNACNED